MSTRLKWQTMLFLQHTGEKKSFQSVSLKCTVLSRLGVMPQVVSRSRDADVQRQLHKLRLQGPVSYTEITSAVKATKAFQINSAAGSKLTQCMSDARRLALKWRKEVLLLLRHLQLLSTTPHRTTAVFVRTCNTCGLSAKSVWHSLVGTTVILSQRAMEEVQVLTVATAGTGLRSKRIRNTRSGKPGHRHSSLERG